MWHEGYHLYATDLELGNPHELPDTSPSRDGYGSFSIASDCLDGNIPIAATWDGNAFRVVWIYGAARITSSGEVTDLPRTAGLLPRIVPMPRGAIALLYTDARANEGFIPRVFARFVTAPSRSRPSGATAP